MQRLVRTKQQGPKKRGRFLITEAAMYARGFEWDKEWKMEMNRNRKISQLFLVGPFQSLSCTLHGGCLQCHCGNVLPTTCYPYESDLLSEAEGFLGEKRQTCVTWVVGCYAFEFALERNMDKLVVISSRWKMQLWRRHFMVKMLGFMACVKYIEQFTGTV